MIIYINPKVEELTKEILSIKVNEFPIEWRSDKYSSLHQITTLTEERWGTVRSKITNGANRYEN